MRRRDYVAAVLGRTPQGRRLWRLYSVPRSGVCGPADALGDYDRLAKIGAILARQGRVRALRVVRRQVVLEVYPQA